MTTKNNVSTDSPNGWNEIQVGGMNPEYQKIQSDQIMEESECSDSIKQTTELYASVAENSYAPPLPGPRRTKSNPCYEPSGNTLTHPTTLGNHNHQPPVVDMEIELDYSDINSRKCTILIALSVLIGFGIIMTLLAVIFAMLMMFGVIQLTCRSTLQSGTSNCSCSGDSSQVLLFRLQNQTRDLTEKIRLLNTTIAAATRFSATEYKSLNFRANNLSMSLDSTNKSCHSTLDSILTFGNATFRANLSSVDMFSECLAEYLSNCTIHSNTSCQTTSHPLKVPGYRNIDIACHVSVPSNETPLNATINNVIISENIVSCSCTAQGNKTTVINCLLFRMRCPVEQNIGVPIITNS